MTKSLAVLFFFGFLALTRGFAQSKEILYVGTFSFRESKGIYVYEFDRTTQRLTLLQTVSDGLSPSFLELHPNGTFLYAVYRTGLSKQENTGSVVAYRIDTRTGTLTKINEQSSEGMGPCHISIDPRGRFAFVSNYQQANVVSYPLRADGSLAPASGQVQHTGKSIDPQRQEAAHAHSMVIAADGLLGYASDLGIDKVMIYKINAQNGSLSPTPQGFVSATAGAGPRHFVIHPNQRWAYSLEEMASTVVVFDRTQKTGELRPKQRISILPEAFSAASKAADIHITPNGRFLYASNRGHDKIGMFEINAKTGQLTRIGYVESGGQEPRNFCVDKKGIFVFVANQNTDNFLIFNINPTTGQLTTTGQELKIPAPVCIKQLLLEK